MKQQPLIAWLGLIGGVALIVALFYFGGAFDGAVDCSLPRNIEHKDCERENLQRDLQRQWREEQRQAGSSTPAPPSRGPVYVDCNAFGVVNEDTDHAYRAADRGEKCR